MTNMFQRDWNHQPVSGLTLVNRNAICTIPQENQHFWVGFQPSKNGWFIIAIITHIIEAWHGLTAWWFDWWWLEHVFFLCFQWVWGYSSQVTNSYFSEGLKPPTSDQKWVKHLKKSMTFYVGPSDISLMWFYDVLNVIDRTVEPGIIHADQSAPLMACISKRLREIWLTTMTETRTVVFQFDWHDMSSGSEGTKELGVSIFPIGSLSTRGSRLELRTEFHNHWKVIVTEHWWVNTCE